MNDGRATNDYKINPFGIVPGALSPVYKGGVSLLYHPHGKPWGMPIG